MLSFRGRNKPSTTRLENYAVTVEQILPAIGIDPAQARLVHWERAATTGVIPIPGGAHPTSCAPLYGFDVPHFNAYAASAKEGGIQAYLDKHLGASEEEYQASVGGLDAIRAIAMPVY